MARIARSARKPYASRLPTLKERQAHGKALRAKVPRAAQGQWAPWPGRPDPIEQLRQQNRQRVKSLVPIRYARMLQSPFAFMRGAAAVMAHDLAKLPLTGYHVNACGDCHLANFGGYATPERNFVFDINDFDETLLAPWEFDVKRLAASIVVAGRSTNFDDDCCDDAALSATRHYREHMARLAKKTALQVWYSHLDVEDILKDIAQTSGQLQSLERGALRVRGRTPDVILGKMTENHYGVRRFIDNPPFVYHSGADHAHSQIMHSVIDKYRDSLRADVRVLFDRYQLVDMAVKVVGVGSVGTRCGVLLFMAGKDDALILQTKEANHSVLETPKNQSPFRNQGQRVVTGQRIMQAASDAFLGWTSYRGRDYYVRQLRDMKASIELELLTGRSFIAYAQVCGTILARAHARTGDAAVISGYLGASDRFDRAIARFARQYANQTERDYAALKAAHKKGTIHPAPTAR